MQKLKLTREDWVEIHEALAMKVAQIKDGFYGCEQDPGDDEAWIADLKGLLKIIGKEGQIAFKSGVRAEHEQDLPRVSGKNKILRLCELAER